LLVFRESVDEDGNLFDLNLADGDDLVIQLACPDEM